MQPKDSVRQNVASRIKSRTWIPRFMGIGVMVVVVTCLLALPALVNAEQIASGIWTSDNGPHYITQNQIVEQGSDLVLAPGVELNFAENTGIYVEGRLIIEGNDKNPVVLRSINPEEIWSGIQIHEKAYEGCKITHAIISDVDVAFNILGNVDLTLQNSTISAKNAVLVADSDEIHPFIIIQNSNLSVCQSNPSSTVAKISNTHFELTGSNVYFEINEETPEEPLIAFRLNNVSGTIRNNLIHTHSNHVVTGFYVKDCDNLCFERSTIRVDAGNEGNDEHFASAIRVIRSNITINHINIDLRNCETPLAFGLHISHNSDVHLTNSIISHSDDIFSTQYYAFYCDPHSSSSSILVDYCCFYQVQIPKDVSDVFRKTNKITIFEETMVYDNPRWQNPEAGVYLLMPNSSCIDAGSPLETDPDGSCPDIGQYYCPQNNTDAGETGASVPTEFSLEPAWPNPFNASTQLQVNLPEKGVLTMAIYDVLGRRVQSVSSGIQSAGVHTFSISFDQNSLSSGIYFVRASFGQHCQTQKLTLVR